MESQMSSVPYTQSCRRFSLEEILSVTQNFDDDLVVGKGGFGKVYKATVTVENGEISVAIKRLDLDSSQGATEFWAEIEMLSKLRHCNLVSLIGYCNEIKEMILIYEFMPLGTLAEHLHKNGASLSWVQRLTISIGAARGLHYLHTGIGTQQGVIHRDVKSSNILLDKDYAAKISDFGLSKIGPTNTPGTYVNTLVRGTFGYLDPEYFLTGRLTRKSDVFAFGVVLFELLCGRAALDNNLDEEKCSLAKWAHESIDEGKVHEIIDFKIKSQIAPKCLKVFVQIGDRCLSSESKKRPTMAEILVDLELSLTLQNKFDSRVKPASGVLAFAKRFGWPFISPEVNSAQSDEKPSTINEASRSSSKDDRLNHVEGVSSRTESTDGIDNGNSSGSKNSSVPSIPRSEGEILQSCNLKSFGFSDLRKATRNFRPDSLLGEGGFGRVFKGWIDEQSFAASTPGTGVVVAVKIRDAERFQDHREWLAEVNYLGQFSHPNLVNLIGYCLEDDHRLLVYEFMPKGSLENHLFRRGSYFQPLSWSLRLKVALGAAKGLAFLHSAETKVIYRDFKTSNVLLDSDYNAKLSDFGLAKDESTDDQSNFTTWFMGTYDYTAPEYVLTGHLSAKSDVYSFGVVLLEMLSGRRARDKNRPTGEQSLVEWAKPYLPHKRKLFRILDDGLEGQYTLDEANTTANLALRCVSMEPWFRPNMADVVKELELLQDPIPDSCASLHSCLEC